MSGAGMKKQFRDLIEKWDRAAWDALNIGHSDTAEAYRTCIEDLKDALLLIEADEGATGARCGFVLR